VDIVLAGMGLATYPNGAGQGAEPYGRSSGWTRTGGRRAIWPYRIALGIGMG